MAVTAWKCRDVTLDINPRTLIMGILNVTPDSFSDGGRFVTLDRAIERALQMQEEGADIIDIGGESTRPGAQSVSVAEEQDRILPVIEKLMPKLTIPISIDTTKASVAEAALARGARIINDISGCRFDPQMPEIAARYKAGLVLMHIKGEPRTMQDQPHYENVMNEIKTYLEKSMDIAFRAGVRRQQIVIDPGIGFGKRLQDNFQILRELRILTKLGVPILVGPSRKSMIGKVLDAPPEERLEGTLAAVSAAILNGAAIIRVHDVRANVRAAKIADAIVGKNEIQEML